jgi:UDP-N-acetylglucosamine:LPS N-acetylglucosamine transferase
MNRAEYIITRSGYSTIMDIIKLQKKSILIPTPGQTEQEYLGKYLVQKKIALCISQKKFFLNAALREANKFSYRLPSLPANNKLRETIEHFIASFR